MIDLKYHENVTDCGAAASGAVAVDTRGHEPPGFGSWSCLQSRREASAAVPGRGCGGGRGSRLSPRGPRGACWHSPVPAQRFHHCISDFR